MALWGFTPEEVMTDGLEFSAFQSTFGDGTRVVGPIGVADSRTFRLRYGLVTSADCAAMRAFYRARRGAADAFDWIHPTEGRVYLVRFESSLPLSLFTPVFFQSGGELVFRVVDA